MDAKLLFEYQAQVRGCLTQRFSLSSCAELAAARAGGCGEMRRRS